MNKSSLLVIQMHPNKHTDSQVIIKQTLTFIKRTWALPSIFLHLVHSNADFLPTKSVTIWVRRQRQTQASILHDPKKEPTKFKKGYGWIW